jgi:fused signal recognition particle receptor
MAKPLDRFPLQVNPKAVKPFMLGRIFCGKPGSTPDQVRGRLFSGKCSITAPIMNETQQTGWLQRLTGGLRRTSSQIGTAISDLVMRGPLSPERIVEIEEMLIRADLGGTIAARIAAKMGEGRYHNLAEVQGVLAAEVETVLTPVAQPLVIAGAKPFVVLVVGVNGSGKTTTIGKLAAKFRAEGRKVVLAAGDTFRAAAIDQLKIWGTRTGATVVAREPGADSAGLAYEALETAKQQGADVLLIDTAGRLQNKAALMGELEKVVRVLKKLDPAAPHAVLLVLDATVGQNALSQVAEFGKTAGVTGLAMTKLDGTARGGILVAIAEKFGLPVHFIGVGESVEDLEPFQARDFARAIAGME